MRLFCLTLAGALALAAPAAAEPKGVAAAFGNTVRAIYEDGKSQWLWLNADGTWKAFGRRGKWSSGRWTQNDENKVCLRQSKPFPAPIRYCTDFPADGGVGAVWASRSMDGRPIKVTVIKGVRQP